MSTEPAVTPKWLEIANGNPVARAMAIGAVSFLVAHGVAAQEFEQAAKRGDYVSTVFTQLDRVGQAVASDQLGGKIADKEITDFWRREIELAAQGPAKKTAPAHD